MKRQTIKELRNFARRRFTGRYGFSAVEKDALIRAAINNMNLGEAKELVKAGADVNAENGDGNSPLYFASNHCKPDVIKFLISEGADVNHQAKDGRTPLFAAASNWGSKEAVKILLEAGADPTIVDENGQNVLTNWCNPNTALMILESGVDVNIQDKNGMTLLHEAVQRPWSGDRSGSYSHEANFIEILIEKGADVNIRNKIGVTPLPYTVADNLFGNAWILLDNGADIDSQDNDGETALITAVKLGRLTFARFLLECGADASLKCKEGTALDIAEANGNTKISSLLRSYGEDTDKRRHFRR